MVIQRQTANKIWINQLVNGEFIRQEGFNPSYIVIHGNNVSRVNIMATVVSKFLSEDENYGTITVDDGTETIRAKAFGPDVIKIKDVNIGTIVTLVGKVKNYKDETYISPEIARKVDNPNWLIVRKLEIGEPVEIKKEVTHPLTGQEPETKPEKEATSSDTKAEEVETIKISPEKEQENLNDKLLNLIKSQDKGEGADMDKVLDEMNIDKDECKNLIIGLLKSGDLFEPKKGMLKVLD